MGIGDTTSHSTIDFIYIYSRSIGNPGYGIRNSIPEPTPDPTPRIRPARIFTSVFPPRVIPTSRGPARFSRHHVRAVLPCRPRDSLRRRPPCFPASAPPSAAALLARDSLRRRPPVSLRPPRPAPLARAIPCIAGVRAARRVAAPAPAGPRHSLPGGCPLLLLLSL